MFQLNRRSLTVFALLAVLIATLSLTGRIVPAQAGDVQVQEATDLARLGELARDRQVPILIMFSMHGCPYCDIVREEFLKPMLISGDYAERVIIREIHSDSYATLRDFDGRDISADALAHRYRASLSPTVVFLDHQGRELSPRMVGVTTVDYYGGYLDEAIDQSLQRMRQLALADAP